MDQACVTSGRVLGEILGTLQAHLHVPMGPNRQHTPGALFRTLVGSAARRTSIHHFTRITRRTPSDGAIRYHLKKVPLHRVQRSLNAMFRRHAACLQGKPRRVAVDLVLNPYQGKPHRRADEIVRGKAKAGTTRFHAYATAYTMENGRRITLAIEFVRAGDDLVGVLDSLLRQARKSVPVRALFLDKEFCRVDVMRYLRRHRIPHVIPVPMRPGKMRRLCRGKRSFATAYTMVSRKRRRVRSVTFRMHVAVKYAKPKGYRRRGAVHFAYAVYGMDLPVRATFGVYRRRFGIESSYALHNITRARTSSRDPAYRLLLVGLSLVMVNAWVYLRWEFLGVRRRGRRLLLTWEYRTAVFMVTRAVERRVGFREVWEAPASGPPRAAAPVPTAGP